MSIKLRDFYLEIEISRSELIYAYRWNRENMFYLLVYFEIESEIAVKS